MPSGINAEKTKCPRFAVQPAFFSALALILALRLEKDAGLLLVSALLHEAGHLLCVLLFGGRVESVLLTPFGLRMFTRGDISRAGEAAALFMGPLVNLFAAWLFWKGGHTGAAAENLVLGVYNLLPAKGLDGGRLLGLLAPRRGEQAAEMIGMALAVFFLGLSLYAIRTGENFIAPLLAAWMMILGR